MRAPRDSRGLLLDARRWGGLTCPRYFTRFLTNSKHEFGTLVVAENFLLFVMSHLFRGLIGSRNKEGSLEAFENINIM